MASRAGSLRAALLFFYAYGGAALWVPEYPFGGSTTTGFAVHYGGGAWTYKDQFGFNGGGGGRMYLIENRHVGSWGEASYVKFNLLGKTLRYTVDLSNVGCGAVATLYFSAMGHPNGGDPNYCDIKPDAGGCFELDIMEANSRGFEVSLHTRTGTGFDGTCNEMGCSTNVGRYPFTIERPRARTTSLYGPGAYIDSRRPFQVVAAMDESGGLRVQLEQQHDTLHTLRVYNRSSAWNFPEIRDVDNEAAYPLPTGIPDADFARVAPAMWHGLTLVTSLWASDNTRWLDMTGCIGAPSANLDKTSYKVSGLSLTPTEETVHT